MTIPINEFVQVITILCSLHSSADFDKHSDCIDFYNNCAVDSQSEIKRDRLEVCIKNYTKDKK